MSDQDEVIKRLIEKASAKSKEIGLITNYSSKTNLLFPLGDGVSISNSINLNTVREPKQFVRILAVLLAQSDYFEKACKSLGTKATFTWGGFSKSSWVHDIKNRVDSIALAEKKKSLALIKKQLDELMSPEMKRKQKLEELEKALED